MKKLIAGNWKMNLHKEDAVQLASSITQKLSEADGITDKCDILICPPTIHISSVLDICKNTAVNVGGQDCSIHNEGAYTGQTSPSMLKDYGCTYTILGHSERREYQNETDSDVNKKAESAHKNGLIAIICVGESEAERNADAQEQIVERQLTHSIPTGANAENTVIAYEPVWAIGTGKTASPADVEAMHAHIRNILKQTLKDGSDVRILYGGSMKPENAADLLSTPNVDGGLIGGASLKADQFIEIAEKA